MVKSTPGIDSGITSSWAEMGTAVRQAHMETKVAPRDNREKEFQIGGMESTPILMETTLPAHTARSVVNSPMGSGLKTKAISESRSALGFTQLPTGAAEVEAIFEEK